MTFAASHNGTFGEVSTSVYTPQQGAASDVPGWVQWFPPIVRSLTEKGDRIPTAVCEPVEELATWRSHNGLASHVNTRWDAIQVERTKLTPEAATEDTPDEFLSLDLTVRLSPVREFKTNARIVRARKWTPNVAGLEGIAEAED